MSHPPAHPQPSACDEEYSLPCAEALLAGSLALMTGYAQAGEPQREALGAKIAVNLQQLAGLGSLTPHFRTMLANLHERWACQGGVAAHRPRALWHAAPETLQ